MGAGFTLGDERISEGFKCKFVELIVVQFRAAFRLEAVCLFRFLSVIGGEGLQKTFSNSLYGACHEQPDFLRFLVSASGLLSIISCILQSYELERVKRGVAAQHPAKYNLDEKELERVSALARIELEDAKLELQRAHEAAKEMGKGAEGEEADDQEEDESAWVE